MKHNRISNMVTTSEWHHYAPGSRSRLSSTDNKETSNYSVTYLPLANYNLEASSIAGESGDFLGPSGNNINIQSYANAFIMTIW